SAAVSTDTAAPTTLRKQVALPARRASSWALDLPLEEVADFLVEARRVLDVGNVRRLRHRAVLRAGHFLRELGHERGRAAHLVFRAGQVERRRLDLRQLVLEVEAEERRGDAEVAERGGGADHVAHVLQDLGIRRVE